MAIYHCSAKIIGRSAGRSIIAAVAYRTGTKLLDKETGIVYDYTHKGGVVYAETMLPPEAPVSYQDRAALWESVQKVEKQSTAQLAREIEVALPVEMDRAQQLAVLRTYIQDNFVRQGMCADWALHDKGDGNPHAHILLTTRAIKPDGEWASKQKSVYKLDAVGQKIPMIDPATGKQKIGARGRRLWMRETIPTTDWNEKYQLEAWRASWAQLCNQYLDVSHQIDHRSYAARGLLLEPTQHEGAAARKMERSGQVSARCEENRMIAIRNASIVTQIQTLTQQIAELVAEKWREIYDRLEQLLRRRAIDEAVRTATTRDRDADRADTAAICGQCQAAIHAARDAIRAGGEPGGDLAAPGRIGETHRPSEPERRPSLDELFRRAEERQREDMAKQQSEPARNKRHRDEWER